jgi:hypothetical protein
MFPEDSTGNPNIDLPIEMRITFATQIPICLLCLHQRLFAIRRNALGTILTPSLTSFKTIEYGAVSHSTSELNYRGWSHELPLQHSLLIIASPYLSRPLRFRKIVCHDLGPFPFLAISPRKPDHFRLLLCRSRLQLIPTSTPYAHARPRAFRSLCDHNFRVPLIFLHPLNISECAQEPPPFCERLRFSHAGARARAVRAARVRPAHARAVPRG